MSGPRPGSVIVSRRRTAVLLSRARMERTKKFLAEKLRKERIEKLNKIEKNS